MPLASRPQPQSPLFALPPECLEHVVSFSGRTKLHPHGDPSNLLRTCRDMHAIGQSISCRISFLVTVYGTRHVGEGMACWLGLLTADVVEGVFRRAGTVPRYVLQRLYRRFANGERPELLVPVLRFGLELWPPGRDPGTGFDPFSANDEVSFRALVKLEGSKVPSELLYLVKEGKRIGVAGTDDVAIAVGALRHQFLFDPNFSVAGLSTSGRNFRDAFEDYSARGRAPLCVHGADMGIEALNGGHMLLVEAVSRNAVGAINRLLELGVQVDASEGNFFWESARARELLSSELPPEREPYSEQDRRSKTARSLSRILLNKVISADPQALPEVELTYVPTTTALAYQVVVHAGARVPYNSNATKDNPDVLDAVWAAICCHGPNQSTEDALAALLNQRLADGWFFTDDARVKVERYLEMCIKTEKPQLVKVIQRYTAGTTSTMTEDDQNLLAAIKANDVASARQLMKAGATIGAPDAVFLILDATLSLRTRIFVVEKVELSREHALSVLSSLFRAPTAAGAQPDLLKAALDAYSHLWKDKTGKKQLLQWFAGDKARRDVIRPHLGTAEELVRNRTALSNTTNRAFIPNHSAVDDVVAYDIRAAIDAGNVEDIRKLIPLGGGATRAGTGAFTVHDFVREFLGKDANRYPTNDTIIAFLELANDNTGSLSDVLTWAVRRGDSLLVGWLLAPERGKRPKVTSDAVRGSMTKPNEKRGPGMFKKLLAQAATQKDMISGPRLARRMAESRGGEWKAAWEEYEDKFSEAGVRR